MTDDSTPDFIDSLPKWLADVVHARHSDLDRARESRAVDARLSAEIVNNRLEALGITPLRPAAGSDGGWLTAALLVDPGWDDGEETWGVEADWDNGDRRVVLIASLPGERARAGELTSVEDVVRAMYEGPIKPVIREGRPVGGQRIDTADVVGALHELTAAVLHLADETARLR
jgi:hypothetical protein